MQKCRIGLSASAFFVLALLCAGAGSARADDEARKLIDRIYRADLHQCEQQNNNCRLTCRDALDEDCWDRCDARQRRCERTAERKAARDRLAD